LTTASGDRFGEGQSGAEPARFIDTAADRLVFTVISVTDELNAFKVFETLNARGVRLSSTEKAKPGSLPCCAIWTAMPTSTRPWEMPTTVFGLLISATTSPNW